MWRPVFLLPLLALATCTSARTFVASTAETSDVKPQDTSGRMPRFILVGNYSGPENAWNELTLYDEWAAENPLYVGDVVIFRYFQYQHVVWQLPTQDDYDKCRYDNAYILGNDSAGVGLGVAYVVTEEPAFFACGVFGHCEDFGQKVVIKATLGPMPENPRKAPAQIPNPYPTLPPPAYPPPPGVRAPPPPKQSGPLARIFTSAEAGDYSIIWSLLQPLAFQLENTVQTFTLLAPRDDAVAQYMDAIDAQLSLLPDDASRSAFLARLLQYHVVPSYAPAEDIRSWPGTQKTLLGPNVGHNGNTLSFYGSEQPYSSARIVDKDLQELDSKGTGKISVQGINGVLFPRKLETLIPLDLLNKYSYGTDPPPPKVDMTPKLKDELEVQIPGSNYGQLQSVYFSNFSAAINNSLWDLWPWLASQGGITILPPTDEAFSAPWWLLARDLAETTLADRPGSFRYWLRNVAVFHALATYKNNPQWLNTNAFSGTPTLLEPTAMFFRTQDGVALWFANRTDSSVNGSCSEFPDLQSAADTIISIQGINRVLLPQNKSRLVPASAMPRGEASAPPPSAPAPQGSAPPPSANRPATPPPRPAPSFPPAPQPNGSPSAPLPSPLSPILPLSPPPRRASSPPLAPAPRPNRNILPPEVSQPPPRVLPSPPPPSPEQILPPPDDEIPSPPDVDSPPPPDDGMPQFPPEGPAPLTGGPPSTSRAVLSSPPPPPNQAAQSFGHARILLLVTFLLAFLL